jgi:hypothetical protein
MKLERRLQDLVTNLNGQKLAYVYYEEEPGRRLARNCSRAMKREGPPLRSLNNHSS